MRLYHKFPDATPGQLTWAKRGAVCKPTQVAVAIKRLSLQTHLLYCSSILSTQIESNVSLYNEMSYADVVNQAWKMDPPKALGDILEAVVGAIYVDCGFDIDIVDAILEDIMKEVVEILHPKMQLDPISELMIWSARHGCDKVKLSCVSL